MASVKAKPKIANLNKLSSTVGFLEVPSTKDAKTSPIPIPAPASPVVDKPAPIFWEAVTRT